MTSYSVVIRRLLSTDRGRASLLLSILSDANPSRYRGYRRPVLTTPPTSIRRYFLDAALSRSAIGIGLEPPWQGESRPMSSNQDLSTHRVRGRVCGCAPPPSDTWSGWSSF